MAVHSSTTIAWLVTIDDTIHAHSQRDKAVCIAPVHSRNLLTAQSLSTSHGSTGCQKGNHHTLRNPEAGNHTSRTIHVCSSNMDLFVSSNNRLNYAVFRSNEDSTFRHLTMPTLEALRRMSTDNDAVTQLLLHCEQGNGQELIQGKPAFKDLVDTIIQIQVLYNCSSSGQ